MVRLLTLTSILFATALATEVLIPADNSVPAPAQRLFIPPITSAVVPSDPSRTAWLPTVLGRPLFAPGRRPEAGSVAADPGLPRLSGIIGTPDGTVAIFQPAMDGKPVLARNGDQVGGWQIASVESDAVTLRKADARMVLHPHFSTAAAKAGPQPALLPLPGRR